MNILKIIKDKIMNLDSKIKHIMHIGLIFSFILCMISSLSLFTYEVFYSLPKLFYTGISLLRSSLIFACTFFICGIGFDTIKKELN